MNRRPIDAEIIPPGAPRPQPAAQLPAGEQPIRLELELWPRRFAAKAKVIYQDGRPQELEVKSPVLATIMAVLRAAGVQF
jgi:hypothetical protein